MKFIMGAKSISFQFENNILHFYLNSRQTVNNSSVLLKNPTIFNIPNIHNFTNKQTSQIRRPLHT